MKNEKINGILNLFFPNSHWGIINDDYNTLVWYDDTPKPTYEEIMAFEPEYDAIKAKELQFYAKTVNGFLVQPENFILGLTEKDITLLTSFMTLIQEGVYLNKYTENSTEIIYDIDGVAHQIAIPRLREILYDYGSYFKTMYYNMR